MISDDSKKVRVLRVVREMEREPYAEIVVKRRLRRDDEPTQKIDFDKRELSPSDALVLGYLTMEQHGMFAELSPEEQEQAALNLLRR